MHESMVSKYGKKDYKSVEKHHEELLKKPETANQMRTNHDLNSLTDQNFPPLGIGRDLRNRV